jgi:poly-gamma-glutamate biosynthesis protein PgsC/CapC
MIVTSFALAIALGFVFFEFTGLAAGGIIVPGYMAIYLDQPIAILLTIVVSLITYLVVLSISKFTILFGRRRFLMVVLIGFFFRAGFDWLRIYLPPTALDLQVIGYIIPGLIANEFFRQGILKTLMAMTIVSVLVYLILKLVYF